MLYLRRPRCFAPTVYSILLAISCFGQETSALPKLYSDAKTAEQAGDYTGATKLYERIVVMRPDLAEAHANLGNLYYVQGLYDQARRTFRTALKLKPQLVGPQFFLGVLAFRSRDFKDAIANLNRAAALDPGNLLIQLQLGYTYYATGDHPKAIEKLEAVARTETQNEDAWYHLSKLYAQMSRRYFDELQLKSPDSYYTHLARAHFYEGQGSWMESAAEYEKAQATKPSLDLSRRLTYLKERSEGKAGEWSPVDDEVDGSTRFLHQPPDLASVQQDFWSRREQSPSTAAGPENLYKAAETHQLLSYLSALWVYGNNPASYRAHQLKGQSLEAAGRNEEAVAEYRAALEKKQDLQTVHFAIGNIHWRAGEFDQALPELQAELLISPNDPQAHYEIGDILLSKGNLDEAAAHYRKSLEHDPGAVEAYLALERIYTSKGQHVEALRQLQRASVAAPSNPTPYYRLWLLYRKQGKHTEAEQARKKFDALKKDVKTTTGPAQ